MHKSFFLILIIIFIVSSHYLINYIKTKPSNERKWEEEFEVLTNIDVNKNIYTFNNVRNWSWSKQGPISKQYISKSLDINQLSTIWFLLQTFDSNKRLAHTFLIFEFKDGETISLSIEARREQGEKYNGLYGMFKKYEIMYTWGTEQDFLGKRAVNMNQNIYMYPLKMTDSGKKEFFKDMVIITNNLYVKPEFYNTLTSNCTNNLAKTANKVKPNSVPIHYSWWLTGLSDKYLYNLSLIPNELSFEQIKNSYYITNYINQNYTKPKVYNDLRNSLRPENMVYD